MNRDKTDQPNEYYTLMKDIRTDYALITSFKQLSSFERKNKNKKIVSKQIGVLRPVNQCGYIKAKEEEEEEKEEE